MRKISNILNTSFPYLSTWTNKLFHIGIILLLCVFFVFGLDALRIDAWIRIPKWISFLGQGGFFLFAFIVMLLSQLFYDKVLKDNDLRIKHVIFRFIVDLLLISIVLTLVYKYKTLPFFSELLATLKYTLLVITLPYVFSLLLIRTLSSSKVKEVDQADNLKYDLLNFTDDKDQIRLSIKSARVLYISSADNYITIYYTIDDFVKKEFIRNTLKRVEHQFESRNFLRCHRSYLINVENIEAIKKVKRSYEVKLKNVDSFIPVSTSFIPKIQHLLTQE